MKSIRAKRTIALLLSILMIFSVFGCGNKQDKTENDVTDVETIEEVKEVVEDSTEKPAVEDSKKEDETQELAKAPEEVEKEEKEEKEEEEEEEDISSVSEDSAEEQGEEKEDIKASDNAIVDASDEIKEDQNEGIELAEAAGNETAEVEESASESEEMNDEIDDSADEEYEEESISSVQRNSLNMLNYMTVITQKVNQSRGNQLYLESAYSSLKNDFFSNSVDKDTQTQIISLLDTIDGYRMISVKKERLEYIYDQNKAQAIRAAIPNPIGLLSAVKSKSKLEIIASVLYMAVDSATSYQAASSQADMQFIKEGWELDDAESTELHNSTKNALSYMFNMVRNYSLPGDYVLNTEMVEDFVEWANKPDSQLVSKIAWLESKQEDYKEFGPYWLELAKDYYKTDDYFKYKRCLEAIEKYEEVTTRIFRKDIDYAEHLPMAIVAAEKTMGKTQKYIDTADRYCKAILDNTKDEDWSLRYFVAQTYIDLYARTEDKGYLDKAYMIAKDNVNNLVGEQRELNESYLSEYKEIKPEKDASKRVKAEIKAYNKAMKKERKIALPPISEALYLNCDLLFALAEEKGISASEKRDIESILHVNGEPIFLTNSIDRKYWYDNKPDEIKAESINIEFDGEKIILPVNCVADRSIIKVEITSGSEETVIDDWMIEEVVRPKKTGLSDFTVEYSSKNAKKQKYKAGDTISVVVLPVEDSTESLTFNYEVVGVKKLFVVDDVSFVRK